MFGMKNTDSMHDQHCPKCGRSTAIQSMLMIVLDFSNWLQLLLSIGLVIFAAHRLAFALLETLGIVFLTLVAMVTSLRRKNFCERCEIEFVPAAPPLPHRKL